MKRTPTVSPELILDQGMYVVSTSLDGIYMCAHDFRRFCLPNWEGKLPKRIRIEVRRDPKGPLTMFPYGRVQRGRMKRILPWRSAQWMMGALGMHRDSLVRVRFSATMEIIEP